MMLVSTLSRWGYAAPPAQTLTARTVNGFSDPRSADVCTIPPDCKQYETGCVEGDFKCLCGKTDDLGNNQFFDSVCVYDKCQSTAARLSFIDAYKVGCNAVGKQLNIPPSWRDYFVKPTATTTPAATPSGAPMCPIPEKCQRHSEKITPRCQYDDFDCVCRRSVSMQDNEYFDIDCVYNECPVPAEKREFMRRYSEACKQAGIKLSVPQLWATWAPSATSAQSMLAVTSFPISSPRTITTAAILPLAKTDAAAIAQSATMSSTSAPPQDTNLADQQIPICGISKLCLKRQEDNTLLCPADDFDCICRNSNSLANNSQFNQQCVFDECKLDIGREELIQKLSYHCQKVGKQLTDIPDQWAFYLPKPTGGGGTSPPSPTSLSNSTLPGQTPPRIRLTDGAIAGIAIGGLVALGALGALLFILWRARKKSQDLTRKNAILADRSSAYGASARIERVMREENSPCGRSMHELGSSHSRSVHEVGSVNQHSMRVSTQTHDIRALSPSSITATDAETLIGGAGGRDAFSSPPLWTSQIHKPDTPDEYYSKYPESDLGSSTIVDAWRDQSDHGEWGSHGEYYGKYVESGTGTPDTYERGVRERYAEGKAQQRSEHGSMYGPDGVRRYGREDGGFI